MNNLNLDDFKIQLETHKTKLQTELTNIATSIFKFIFDNHPEVNTITIRNWTPVFNDGEECYPESNIERPEVNGESWHTDLGRLIGQYTKCIDTTLSHNLFGNNTEIVITRDSITKSEFDCGC